MLLFEFVLFVKTLMDVSLTRTASYSLLFLINYQNVEYIIEIDHIAMWKEYVCLEILIPA